MTNADREALKKGGGIQAKQRAGSLAWKDARLAVPLGIRSREIPGSNPGRSTKYIHQIHYQVPLPHFSWQILTESAGPD